MSTPSRTDTDTGGRHGPSITSCFAAGADVATSRPWLALVPLVAGLLSLDQLERAARADVTMQINFGLPTPVAGVWTFLNAPASGVSVVGYSGPAVRNQPSLLVTGLATTAGVLLVTALLTAVYLGAIDDALAGASSDHLDNLTQHAPVTVAFAALQFVGLATLVVVGVLVIGVGSLTGGAALLVVPVFIGALVALYLLTPGVYVGVAAELAPRAAFGRGFEIALTGRYLAFVLVHVALGAVVSVPLSSLAFAAGLPSVLLAAVIAAPVGLVLNAATMAFVRNHAGVGGGNAQPSAGHGDGRDPQPADDRTSGLDGVGTGTDSGAGRRG